MQTLQDLRQKLGPEFGQLSDTDLVAAAAEMSGLTPESLGRAYGYQGTPERSGGAISGAWDTAKQMVKQGGAGYGDAAGMLHGAAEYFLPDGSKAQDFARSGKEYWERHGTSGLTAPFVDEPGTAQDWEPDLEDKSVIPRSLIRGMRAAIPSATAIGATLAGGPVAGGAVSFGLFGGSSAQSTLDDAREAGIPEDEAREAALINMMIEGGGETVANLLGARFIRGAVAGRLKDAYKKEGLGGAIRLAKDPAWVIPFAKQWGANAVVQSSTEFGQEFGTTKVRNIYDISDDSPWEAGQAGAEGGFGLAMIMGPFGAYSSRGRGKLVEEAGSVLENRNASPEQRSIAAQIVANDLKTDGIDAVEVDTWLAAREEGFIQDRDAVQAQQRGEETARAQNPIYTPDQILSAAQQRIEDLSTPITRKVIKDEQGNLTHEDGPTASERSLELKYIEQLLSEGVEGIEQLSKHFSMPTTQPTAVVPTQSFDISTLGAKDESRVVLVTHEGEQRQARVTRISQVNAKRIEHIASKLFGKQINWFENDTTKGMWNDGFYDAANPNTINLSIDAMSAHHLVVFGHELYHAMKNNNADIANKFATAVGLNLNADGMTGYAQYNKDPNLSKEGLREELEADLLGNHGMTKKNLERFFRSLESPSAISKALDVIMEFVEGLNSSMSQFATRRGGQDAGFTQSDAALAKGAITEIKKAAYEALRDYSNSVRPKNPGLAKSIDTALRDRIEALTGVKRGPSYVETAGIGKDKVGDKVVTPTKYFQDAFPAQDSAKPKTKTAPKTAPPAAAIAPDGSPITKDYVKKMAQQLLHDGKMNPREFNDFNAATGALSARDRYDVLANQGLTPKRTETPDAKASETQQTEQTAPQQKADTAGVSSTETKGERTTGEQITAAFDSMSADVAAGPRDAMAKVVRDGDTARTTFSKPESVAAAKANPNYEVRDNADGTVTVTGVKDSTGNWVRSAPVKNSVGRIQTDTPAFKKWFGDSKAVDADGKPLVVYHGTPRKFNEFNRGDDPGFFFSTELDYAKGYGKNIIAAYIRAENPYITTPDAFDSGGLSAAEAERAGYDAFIMDYGVDGKDIAVFKPTQIKSATGNDGNFDATNPDIRRSAARSAPAFDTLFSRSRAKEMEPIVRGKLVEQSKPLSPEQWASVREIALEGLSQEDRARALAAEEKYLAGIERANRDSERLKGIASRVLDKVASPVLSTVRFLQGSQKPVIKGTGKNGKIRVYDVARYLRSRTLKSAVDINTEQGADKAALALFHEALYSLSQDGNAVGWYDRKVAEAIAVTALAHPEILTDPSANFHFRAIAAITSNGQAVRDNFMLANDVYKIWRKTGSLPIGQDTGGQRTNAMSIAFGKVNDLVRDLGLEATERALMQMRSVREIESEFGLKINGENQDTLVPTAVGMGGPKIGNFFANLSGYFDSPTMDLWFMRTIGRMTGGILNTKEGLVGHLETLTGLLPTTGSVHGTPVAIIRAEIARYSALPADQRMDVEATIKTLKKTSAYARAQFSKFAAMDADGKTFTDKSPQNENARALISNLAGLVEAPTSGEQRNRLRLVVTKTLDLLKAEGITLTAADLQAVLWYHEKNLYGKLGDISESAKPWDYASAARFAVGREYGLVDVGSSKRAGSVRKGQPGVSEDVVGGVGAPVQEDAGKGRGKGKGQEGVKNSVARVIFEVAPNPNNAPLTQRWNALTNESKLEISWVVAERILPRILQHFKTSGEIRPQVGSYLEFTNPSFAVLVKNGDVATAIAKMAGHILSQDSMMLVGKKYFPGAKRVDAVRINIGDKDPEAIYNKLREISVNGENPVGGQTTVDGEMVILNYSDTPVAQLSKLIDAELGGQYDVQTDRVWSAFPENKDYGYDNSVQERVGSEVRQDKLARRRRFADRTRSEAESLIESELAARERTEDGGARSDAGGVRRSGGRTEADGRGAAGQAVRTYGQERDGSVSAAGVHYSRQERTSLDSKYYGTGLRGAERKRVMDAEDTRLRKRIHFYVSKDGTAVQPESGVGSYRHEVQLNNLYDPQKDNEIRNLTNEKIVDGWPVRPGSAEWMNAFESAILDAGYNGYVTDFGKQRAAVLMGDHTVDVAPVKNSAGRIQTNTPAFKKWFGTSKATDADGKPMTLYHLTPKDFSEFAPGGVDRFKNGEFDPAGFPASGEAMWFGPDKSFQPAMHSAGTRKGFREGANVMPVYLRINTPLMLDDASMIDWAREVYAEGDANFPMLIGKKALTEIRADGYDGIIYKPDGVKLSDNEYIVFEPTQIKSAIGNDGSFDGTNPDIRRSVGRNAGSPWAGPNGTINDNARIDPLSKSLMKGGIGLFESATDKLRRSGSPILTTLAEKVDRYFDQAEARLGWINGRVRTALLQANRNKKRNMKAFEEFWTHHDNGRLQDAQNVLAANPEVAPLVSSVMDTFDEIGTTNQTVQTPFGVGMKVWDSKLKKFRTIGKITRGKFWPRSMREEVQGVLKDPMNDLKLWNEMVDALINDGHIQTRDEALGYIRNYFSLEVSTDYFAGIEKARGVKLPEIFYDYSWEVFQRYAGKWSTRISQVEQFGQVTNSNTQRDAFEEAVASTLDNSTQHYIKSLADRVYNRQTPDAYSTLLGHLNMLATGLQLGNPATATLNVVGGTLLNVQNFGLLRTMAAFREMIKDWKNVSQTGTELGILNKDVLRILSDFDVNNNGVFDTNTRIQRGLAKFTETTMKWGGYTPMEHIIRATAMLAAKSQLADALKAWNTQPNSLTAKKFDRMVRANRFDKTKLLRENGQGDETGRYLRTMVNIPQGSYRVDQTPIYVDTPTGRFIFKYQKFATQVTRMFWQQMLQPFVQTIQEGKSGAERAQAFLPILRFFGSAVIGGSAILLLRSAAFGMTDPGDDLEDIAKAFENDDTARAWSMIAGRAHANMLAAAGYGMFGNYIQMGLDISDQQRVKNPLSPPGLAPIDSMIELVQRGIEQGKITAKDLDDIAVRTVSLYRSGSRGVATILNESGVDTEFGKLEQYRRDRMYVAGVVRQWADENGIANKRTIQGRIARTPRSPENSEVWRAIASGRPERAKVLIADMLEGLDKSEQTRRLQSLRASMRVRQPITIGGAPASVSNTKSFLEWSEKNLSPANADRVRQMTADYAKNLKAAGL